MLDSQRAGAGSTLSPQKRNTTPQRNASSGRAPPKVPVKFNLAEYFKSQVAMEDIDLSSKSKFQHLSSAISNHFFFAIDLTDNHTMQICQLMKSHAATGVQNLDLSCNKITDNGITNICKALNDT